MKYLLCAFVAILFLSHKSATVLAGAIIGKPVMERYDYDGWHPWWSENRDYRNQLSLENVLHNYDFAFINDEKKKVRAEGTSPMEHLRGRTGSHPDWKLFSSFERIRRSELEPAPFTNLGNMRMFFSHLRHSLKDENVALDANQLPFFKDENVALDANQLPFLEINKELAVTPEAKAQAFTFPKHIRRMIFGDSPHGQPYAHSGLGRR